MTCHVSQLHVLYILTHSCMHVVPNSSEECYKYMYMYICVHDFLCVESYEFPILFQEPTSWLYDSLLINSNNLITSASKAKSPCTVIVYRCIHVHVSHVEVVMLSIQCTWPAE